MCKPTGSTLEPRLFALAAPFQPRFVPAQRVGQYGCYFIRQRPLTGRRQKLGKPGRHRGLGGRSQDRRQVRVERVLHGEGLPDRTVRFDPGRRNVLALGGIPDRRDGRGGLARAAGSGILLRGMGAIVVAAPRVGYRQSSDCGSTAPVRRAPWDVRFPTRQASLPVGRQRCREAGQTAAGSHQAPLSGSMSRNLCLRPATYACTITGLFTRGPITSSTSSPTE